MNFLLKKNLITKLLIKIVLFYIILVLIMFVFQRSFMYFPFGKITKVPKEFQEIFLSSPDNKELYTWYKAPLSNQKTILYFHGNAGNMAGRKDRLIELSKNFGVLAISYRGYSRSQGNPSQEGFFIDAETALDFLFAKTIYPQDIILFGESIGSGVATNMAKQRDFYALILEAPFSSILSIAKKNYWFLPVSLILKDRFESIKDANKISTPLLIFHAKGDKIVPYQEGQKLYEQFNTYKKFISFDGDFHIALTGQYLREQIQIFANEVEMDNKIKLQKLIKLRELRQKNMLLK